ncbi:MAG: class I SAM-dependent methyltransferase [Coriobacteriales bacterium]|jgi:2-polyprenyl-3-methyl-5-hydroxy-6-metoxy-1,4-benzoquinol methylase|nr:class I SAM-dependent methyltransferase [Coriobacteriales bacterium]
MYGDEFGAEQGQQSAPIHETPKDIAATAEASKQVQEMTVEEEAQTSAQARRSFEEMINQQKARQEGGCVHGHHGGGHGHHARNHHACPPEVANVLFSPERLKFHNPQELMQPYLATGMTAIDIGCAKGFFTIPMLELVGQNGKVVAIDSQPTMLEALRHNVSDEQAQHLITLPCSEDDFKAQDYAGQADFVLMFWMLHEIEYTARAVRQAASLLKPGGALMLTEPSFRVSRQNFETCVDLFVAEGLEMAAEPNIWSSYGAVLRATRT